MGYVYLIQNGDLFKIGRTDNLQHRLKQLQPCTVIQTLKTDRSRDLEYELHQRFKSKRVPQTEYFRLTESQVEDAAVALGKTRQTGVSSAVPRGFGSSSSSSAGSYRNSFFDNISQEGFKLTKEEYDELRERTYISPCLTNDEKNLMADGASLEKIKELRRKKKRRFWL